MNKIVLNAGLLVFFISIIFFSQKGMALPDILLRSLVLFVVATIMLSILAIAFIKAINKAAETKRQDSENMLGNKQNG
jgi:membrane protein implicated in regulation of membrane protease activity